jgi:pimeloyl-ACP methyl ester carboxylesterase
MKRMILWWWWMSLSVFLLAQSAWAGPCTTAGAACTEWIALAGGPMRLLVYRTYPLDTKNEIVTGALIMVHGAGRDADNYFRHVLAAAFLADALENTLIISPRFASNAGNSCRDTLAANELNWNCERDTWRTGGVAIDNNKITSYDAADEILRKLARKELFPNLKSIVVAGHSAGGQFVTRYEMSNQVHDSLGVPITYVVSNPSSYAYLDNLRPSPSALPLNIAAGAPGYTPPIPAKPSAPFAAFSDARNCTTYDSWPYGLQNRSGYSARFSDDQLKKQLAARQVTYLLGGLDILPLFGFDSSCAAMAQGTTRLARGLAYVKHVNERYGAQHKTLVIPACGHNARCMFTADPVLPLLFPK